MKPTAITNASTGIVKTTTSVVARRVIATPQSVQDAGQLVRHINDLSGALEDATKVARSSVTLGHQVLTNQAVTTVPFRLRHKLGRVITGYDIIMSLGDVRAYLPVWIASTAYVKATASVGGGLVFPTSGPHGFVFECTTSGTTGGTEPVWPTILGGAVTDGGTLVWTARPYDPSSEAILQFSSAGIVSLRFF